MYDYRGFGESEDFPIVQNQLFHLEFTEDLAAVCDYVYSKTGKAPVLMGISMGSIAVNEYIRKADIPVSHLVFDGYVADLQKWIDKLAEKGKVVMLPKGYKNRKYKQKNRNTLFIVADKDQYSIVADIPKGNADMQHVKVFDCEHISGFFKQPVEYTETILAFLNNN